MRLFLMDLAGKLLRVQFKVEGIPYGASYDRAKVGVMRRTAAENILHPACAAGAGSALGTQVTTVSRATGKATELQGATLGFINPDRGYNTPPGYRASKHDLSAG